jgi:uncharacterized membrane protein (Fun14 family)
VTSSYYMISHRFRCIAEPPVSSERDQSILSQLADNIIQSFYLSEVTIGFVSGYAFKKVSKIVAFWLGLGFIGFQCLAYFGYIRINWQKITTTIWKRIDTEASHEHQEITKKDMRRMVTRWFILLMRILTTSLPSSTGFVTGFMFGFRYG